MPTCKICGKEANNKGSHIVPISLFAGMVNYDGSFKRGDKEITFQLSSKNLGSTYIGRSVPIGEIEKVLGDTKIEDRLSDNQDPLVYDHILCGECEDTLGKIESIVRSSFLKRFFEGKYIFSADNVSLVELECDQQILILYFLSILYRGSIVELHGFKLKRTFESRVKNLLFDAFYGTEMTLIGRVQSSVQRNFDGDLLLISRCGGPDSHGLVFFNPSVLNPYIVSLNDFLVVITESSRTLISPRLNTFYGLDKYIKTEYVTKPKQRVKLLEVPNVAWDSYRYSTQMLLGRPFVLTIKKTFSDVHKRVFGFYPSENIKNYILNRVFNEDCELGVKYKWIRIESIFLDFFRPYLKS